MTERVQRCVAGGGASTAAGTREEALRWLAGRLEFERLLTGLRVRAGVVASPAPPAPVAVPCSSTAATVAGRRQAVLTSA